jgi:hypothetical protein
MKTLSKIVIAGLVAATGITAAVAASSLSNAKDHARSRSARTIPSSTRLMVFGR